MLRAPSIKRWWRQRTGWYEREFNKRWADLAIYNAEKAQGLVHSPAHASRMTAKQSYWDSVAFERAGDAIYTCQPFESADFPSLET